jgi:hypothetical protein
MSNDRIRILCQINAQSICETLGMPNIEYESEEFIKGSFPLVYKKTSLENKVEELTKIIKPNQTIEWISLPYPSHIFYPRV